MLVKSSHWLGQANKHLPKGYRAHHIIFRACCLAKVTAYEGWFAAAPEDFRGVARDGGPTAIHDKRVRVFNPFTTEWKGATPHISNVDSGDFCTLVYATSPHSYQWFAIPCLTKKEPSDGR